MTGCLIFGMSPSYEDEKFNDESDHKVMQKLKHMEVYDDCPD